MKLAAGESGSNFIKGKNVFLHESHSVPSVSSVPSSSGGLSSSTNAKVTKTLNPEEVDGLRSKNLCFYCHKPFFKGHRCSPNQQMQIQFIELQTDIVEESEDTGQ